MAQEWYLLKSPHDQLSGFEDEAFDDFAQEGFNEILDYLVLSTIIGISLSLFHKSQTTI